MQVAGFNHMSFTVADLDRMIAFFTEGLGFGLVSRGTRDPRLISRMTAIPGADLEIAFVSLGGQRVELIAYRGPADRGQVRPRLCDVGAAHVGLDVDDADAAVAIAGRYGFTLAGEIVAIDAGPNQGRRVCYVRAGDGTTVEFLELARP
jgi:catechol 2,3-dioxygenase-like lactoylglutathione lyase family enzyme